MRKFPTFFVYVLVFSLLGPHAKLQSETELSVNFELKDRTETVSFLQKGSRFSDLTPEETAERIGNFEFFQIDKEEDCQQLCGLALNYFFDVVQKKSSRNAEVEKILADAFIDRQQFAQPFLSLMYFYVPQQHKAYKVLQSIVKKHSKLKHGCIIRKEEKNLWKIPCSPDTLEVVEIIQSAYDMQGNLKHTPVSEGVHQARCLKNIYIIEALISQERAQKFVSSLFIHEQKILLKAVLTQMVLSSSVRQKLSDMQAENFKGVEGKLLRIKLTLSRWAAKTHFNNGALLSFLPFLAAYSFSVSAKKYEDDFSITFNYWNHGQIIEEAPFNGLNFGAWFLHFIEKKTSKRKKNFVHMCGSLLIPLSGLIFLQQVVVRSFREQISLYV